jgi:HAD superfamily hydrolase (TIGR01450 family)
MNGGPSGIWVMDLDGVVWLTGTIIPGADDAVHELRARGVRVLFATNNSAPNDRELLVRLARIGIEAPAADLVTSAHAAASLVEPGARVLALADEGVHDALEQRGAIVVADAPFDAVVVGWTHDFDFDRLAAAATAVRAGAKFIGTNDDPTHPTPKGLMPGAGSLLAAVAAAAGERPAVAGKPYPAMADIVRHRAGQAVTMVVGDRPSTDGELARQLHAPFGLVLSGVTAAGAVPADPPAAVVADDLASLVRAHFAS